MSNTFFRTIKIVTNKNFFIIDLVTNRIIENEKIKYFKNPNRQMDLLKKNIIIFKKKIVKKNYSLNDYDAALIDLDVCLKMHNGK